MKVHGAKPPHTRRSLWSDLAVVLPKALPGRARSQLATGQAALPAARNLQKSGPRFSEAGAGGAVLR
eukprot:14029916-Alexandrium_andersonii.AAC.1